MGHRPLPRSRPRRPCDPCRANRFQAPAGRRPSPPPGRGSVARIVTPSARKPSAWHGPGPLDPNVCGPCPWAKATRPRQSKVDASMCSITFTMLPAICSAVCPRPTARRWQQPWSAFHRGMANLSTRRWPRCFASKAATRSSGCPRNPSRTAISQAEYDALKQAIADHLLQRRAVFLQALQSGAIDDIDQSADTLRCLSLDDGREIWRNGYRVIVAQSHGMSRTIPAVVGDCVITLGPKCQLACWEAATGKARWLIDLVLDQARRCRSGMPGNVRSSIPRPIG